MPKKKSKEASAAQETELKTKTDFGRLYPKSSLMLREHVGTAKNGELSYEMALALPQMVPLVRSVQTGKWFTIPWQHIVDAAVKAGVDEP